MRPVAPPEPRHAFGYRRPPRSGNEINGLGESEARRARPVFHNAGGERLEWQALDDFFSFVNPLSVIRHIVANTWQLRRQTGPVAAERVEVDDPAAAAEHIKASARGHGADLVGVTEVTEGDLFEGRSVPFRYAICLGLAMDREEMRWAPQERGSASHGYFVRASTARWTPAMNLVAWTCSSA